jgi:N6-L-threonylcarbamoyladenine synthase
MNKSLSEIITLGIESSCDDTSVAILKGDREVLALMKKSQMEAHQDFGGVVPEIAARAHAEALFPILNDALKTAGITLDKVDVFAATCGPGLIGSLLTGLTLGKTLALKAEKPFVAVHHLEAHFAANFLQGDPVAYPMIGLLISGGHSCLYHILNSGTYQLLGETRDDAVGELYDKIARELGFEMPGAPKLDKLAASTSDGCRFTPPLYSSGDYDFSFSGLKTACLNAISAGESAERVSAGMQQAVVKVLVRKTGAALKETGCKTLLVAGGAAANSGVRAGLGDLCKKHGVDMRIPPISLCMDNGAMVAKAGYDRFCAGYRSELDVKAFSRMALQDLHKGGLWD